MNIAIGDLLVADPSLSEDYHFSRSVVLLSEVHKKGAVGFVLNKPLHYQLRDLVSEASAGIPIFNGGPVEPDNLYFIHSIPDTFEGSIQIGNNLYWGGNFECALDFLTTNKDATNRFKFFLGYSGWESGQLQEELDEDAWVITKNRYKQDIISIPEQTLWKNEMIELGGNYLLYANAPENPKYN